jgi:hypothetical protein
MMNVATGRQGCDVEAVNVETCIDVAGMLCEDLRSRLPNLNKSRATRIECRDMLQDLTATMAQARKLLEEDIRETTKLNGLVREFGSKEGFERWKRWMLSR